MSRTEAAVGALIVACRLGNVRAVEATLDHLPQGLDDAGLAMCRKSAQGRTDILALLCGRGDEFEQQQAETVTALQRRDTAKLRALLPRMSARRLVPLAALGRHAPQQAPLMHGFVLQNLALPLFDLLEEADLLATDAGGNTALHRAAELGQLGLIDAAAERGVDLWTRNQAGQTLLHGASASGQEVVVAGLLRRAPERLNCLGQNQTTPLMWAILGKHFSTVKCLLDAGADLDCTTQDGETALSLATASGDQPLVELLLARPLDLAASIGGSSASYLHRAAELENPAMLLALCRHGAPVRADAADNWPHHAAAKAGSILNLRALCGLDPGGCTRPNRSGQTPLHLAALNGRVEAVIFLADRGADLENRAPIRAEGRHASKGLVGLTPLMMAGLSGSAATIDALRERGAVLSAQTIHGHDVLTYAAAGKRNAIGTSLAQASELATRAGHGHALVTAAARDATALVATLLGAGQTSALVTVNGTSALGLAAEAGAGAAIGLLLAHGADPDDLAGTPPLQAAAGGGHLASMRRLILAGASMAPAGPTGNTPLHAAVLGGHLPAVCCLVAAKHSLDTVNRAGTTPWQLAEDLGRPDIAVFLLACGATVTDTALAPACVDSQRAAGQLLKTFSLGDTRLQRATRAGLFSAATALAGIDPCDDTNPKGETVLHLCRSPELLRQLLAHGATPTLRDNAGRLPVDCALEAGDVACAELLEAAAPSDTAALEARLSAAYVTGNRPLFRQLFAHVVPCPQAGAAFVAAVLSGDVGTAMSAAAGGGVSYDARAEDGRPLLHAALTHRAMLEFLVDWIDWPTDQVVESSGQTVLHVVASCNDIKTLQFFLDRAPGLAALGDKDGLTPASHILSQNENSRNSMLSLLVAAADINAEVRGRTQLYWSAIGNHHALFYALASRGVKAIAEVDDPGSELAVLVQNRQVGLLREYVKNFNQNTSLPLGDLAHQDAVDWALQESGIMAEFATVFSEQDQPKNYNGLVSVFGQVGDTDVHYLGRVRNGNMEGFGTLCRGGVDQKIRQIGRWIDNQLNGMARIEYADGSRFVGHHVAGQRHGPGETVGSAGGRCSATYLDGLRIEPAEDLTYGELLRLSRPEMQQPEAHLLNLLQQIMDRDNTLHCQENSQDVVGANNERMKIAQHAAAQNYVRLMVTALDPRRLWLTKSRHKNATGLGSVAASAAEGGARRSLEFLVEHGLDLRFAVADVALRVARSGSISCAHWVRTNYSGIEYEPYEGWLPWQVASTPEMAELMFPVTPSSMTAREAGKARAEVEALVDRGNYKAAKIRIASDDLDIVYLDAGFRALQAGIFFGEGDFQRAAYFARCALEIDPSCCEARYWNFLATTDWSCQTRTSRAEYEFLKSEKTGGIRKLGGDWNRIHKHAVALELSI